jgi:hypothetical protein
LSTEWKDKFAASKLWKHMFAEIFFLVCDPKPPFHATNIINLFKTNPGFYVATLSDKKVRDIVGEIGFVCCAICKLSHLEA